MSIIRILLALLLFIILDIAWITLNKREFGNQIIMVQRVIMTPNYLGVVLAYAILLFGFYWFVLKNRRPILDAFLLGVLVNGTYEFTNYALLKKWELLLSIKDTLWGGVLWSTVAFVTYNYL